MLLSKKKSHMVTIIRWSEWWEKKLDVEVSRKMWETTGTTKTFIGIIQSMWGRPGLQLVTWQQIMVIWKWKMEPRMLGHLASCISLCFFFPVGLKTWFMLNNYLLTWEREKHMNAKRINTEFLDHLQWLKHCLYYAVISPG